MAQATEKGGKKTFAPEPGSTGSETATSGFLGDKFIAVVSKTALVAKFQAEYHTLWLSLATVNLYRILWCAQEYGGASGDLVTVIGHQRSLPCTEVCSVWLG